MGSWPVATSVPFNFLIIGNENGINENEKWWRVAKGLHEDRANFWMKLREDHDNLNRWNGGGILKISTVLMIFVSFIIFAI
jgi:hypothetical protein